ncbi:MAG: 50S ribosomal protein L9 [Candidatus Peregrinibacteria bacterium]
MATPALVLKAQKIQEERVKKMAEVVANAKELAQQLKEVTLTFKQKVKGEKLYGSIGAKDIAAALLSAQKLEIDKDKIKISAPIKTLGDHKVTLHLAEGVDATLKVVVEAEE